MPSLLDQNSLGPLIRSGVSTAEALSTIREVSAMQAQQNWSDRYRWQMFYQHCSSLIVSASSFAIGQSLPRGDIGNFEGGNTKASLLTVQVTGRSWLSLLSPIILTKLCRNPNI